MDAEEGGKGGGGGGGGVVKDRVLFLHIYIGHKVSADAMSVRALG